MPLVVIQSGVITKSAGMVIHDESYHKGSGLSPEELYINHLGAVDNFTAAGASGNGTATTVTDTHKMALSTGITVVGTASFGTKAPGWTLSIKQLIFTAQILDLQNTDLYWSQRKELGFEDGADGYVQFIQNYDLLWYARTKTLAGTKDTLIATLNNNDIVQIIATSSKVTFYVNGNVVATHTTFIPTTVLGAIAFIVIDQINSTVPSTMSIDYMAVRRVS